MTRRIPTLLILLVVVLLLIIGTISIGAAIYLSSEKTYTGKDGDISITVTGRFQTVAEVVNAAALSLRPEDLVNPSLREPADPEINVQIRRAMPVTVSTELGSRTIWTQQKTIATCCCNVIT